jgi:hypothetical protein
LKVRTWLTRIHLPPTDQAEIAADAMKGDKKAATEKIKQVKLSKLARETDGVTIDELRSSAFEAKVKRCKRKLRGVIAQALANVLPQDEPKFLGLLEDELHDLKLKASKRLHQTPLAMRSRSEPPAAMPPPTPPAGANAQAADIVVESGTEPNTLSVVTAIDPAAAPDIDDGLTLPPGLRRGGQQNQQSVAHA